jgi:hypothetical protein
MYCIGIIPQGLVLASLPSLHCLRRDGYIFRISALDFARTPAFHGRLAASLVKLTRADEGQPILHIMYVLHW